MPAAMDSTALWLMLLLGAYHGLNPGMGWIFAVALGMQEQRGSAVAKSHGAGLMVLPVLLGSSTVEAQAHMTGHHYMPPAASPLAGMLATGIHTVGYLAVTGLVAWAFYRKLGLALLRKTWFNFNLVWGAALVVTGLLTPFM